MTSKRKCPNCGRKIVGHPNKKFCGTKCKDRHHNRVNPRGYFEPANQRNADPLDDMHPFDGDNFS